MLKFLALWIVLMVPAVTWPGESCTYGVDCLEDCLGVTRGNPGGAGDDVACTGANAGLTCANTQCRDKRDGDGIPLRTSAVGDVGQVVFAEDFENPDYANHTATSNGWFDPTCGLFEPNYRGCDSAWHNRYGQSGFSCSIPTNTPTSPSVGTKCCAPGSSCDGSLCSAGEWTPGTDMSPQTGQSVINCIDIWNATDQPRNSEDSALGIPDCPGDDGMSGTGDDIEDCGPFDGAQAMDERTPAGCVNLDASGSVSLGGLLTTVGVTMAFSFPDNHGTSNIDDTHPWKFDEWDDGDFSATCGAPCSEFWMFGSNTHGGPSPFGCLIFSTNPDAIESSQTGSPQIGSFNSNGLNAVTCSVSGAFTQATDWPHGDWACVQAKFTNMKTSSTRYERWLNGTKITDITFDGTSMINDGYERFFYDPYTNWIADCGGCCDSGINQLSRRGRDNMVVTNGNPVSCAEIGSAGGVVGGEPEVEPPTLQGVVISDLVNDPTWWVYNLMETR